MLQASSSISDFLTNRRRLVVAVVVIAGGGGEVEGMRGVGVLVGSRNTVLNIIIVIVD